MKKFLLTGFVVLTFILYSFHQRHDGRVNVIKPTSSSTGTSQSASSSASSGSSGSGGNGGGTGNSNASSAAAYKDGRYTGSTVDAYYGYVQVQATISGGKLSNVKFLQYPNEHTTSVAINQQAMPYLKQEALHSQNANVNIISGATATSQAFTQSLSTALSKAHA